ncbi:MAG: DNA-3-methyladenine glycosylase I [Parvularculaceae bacterium]
MAGKVYCPWAPLDDRVYRDYHDTEWGVPEYDDRALFEKLLLDGFQAGLSWRTILYKRDNFRKAFDGFEAEKIVRYTPKKIERLMQDEGIIRSKTKIDAAIVNARVYLDIMEKEPNGFSGFLWDFVGGAPMVNSLKDYKKHQTTSPESVAMSKELKKRGFKFCGPVIVYAFMQAVGLVNDHEDGCPRKAAVAKMARKKR